MGESTKLLALYGHTLEEERHHWDAHHSRIRLLVTIISALFVATIAGFLRADPDQRAVLLVGPALIGVLSWVGAWGTRRYYQQYLEIITQKTKIQHGLRMDREPPDDFKGPWWATSQLIAPRHMDSREAHEGAREFVDRQKGKGWWIFESWLFWGCLVLALVLGGYLAYVS